MPLGGLDIKLGSNPSTIEILPVKFASAIEDTFMILVSPPVVVISWVSFTKLGLYEILILTNETVLSEVTQTSKLFSGGNVQLWSWNATEA